MLSKVYEKLALRQIMAPYLRDNSVFHQNISTNRKCYFTTATLVAIRDDIIIAIKRGEVTIAFVADVSKAFDTVAYETVLSKLPELGFSKSLLRWIASYLTDRKQYVQTDDRSSEHTHGVTFGEPQALWRNGAFANWRFYKLALLQTGTLVKWCFCKLALWHDWNSDRPM